MGDAVRFDAREIGIDEDLCRESGILGRDTVSSEDPGREAGEVCGAESRTLVEEWQGHEAPPGSERVLGVPTEKSKNFGPSAKRVVRLLRPQRPTVLAVVGLGTVSVLLGAAGPKIPTPMDSSVRRGFRARCW